MLLLYRQGLHCTCSHARSERQRFLREVVSSRRGHNIVEGGYSRSGRRVRGVNQRKQGRASNTYLSSSFQARHLNRRVSQLWERRSRRLALNYSRSKLVLDYDAVQNTKVESERVHAPVHSNQCSGTYNSIIQDVQRFNAPQAPRPVMSISKAAKTISAKRDRRRGPLLHLAVRSEY